MFHNSSWEIPLQASSSDYMLRDMRVERSQWTTFTDHLGSARIPLRQTFIMDTAHFKVKAVAAVYRSAGGACKVISLLW